MIRWVRYAAWCWIALGLAACGNGDNADAVGVGAECSAAAPCPEYAVDGGRAPLACLAQFRGGYCGLQNCTANADCPLLSICVRHTDGVNYCFRRCADKSECNQNRTPANESNCSSNFDWASASDRDGAKACIPPSSG